jgi:hypothetical protein
MMTMLNNAVQCDAPACLATRTKYYRELTLMPI